ncbi:hypothetical protein TGAM01_v208830 [Trichoderma gamsii]|uniref:R3H-associated N-terminal domain-containing protein n=1 Tax=Trichoderma gamsii TaxID=398673 RepID=A0A2P4ZDK3_9HYPO|nr:hypothetical protein TGAM01_v208830 [Trichoderma gamsii]PON22347.1 hypothetical protein TGAM01_v208830 [Trichoderma gamsii]
MAIYSAVPPPPESPPPSQATANIFPATAAPNSAIDIEAWTISALQSLSVSPIARGTGSPLTIPLDALATPSKRSISRQQVTIVTSSAEAALVTPLRRPPSARDSQKRREAVLKGKEGSRQRRRWENVDADRLVDVPNVQPPEPIDWEVHPTHPIHRVPYQLAQFWDHGVRQRIQDKTAKLQAARKKQQLKAGSATGLGIGEVPRDLRESTKRSPVIRTWVKALEEPMRQYMANERQRRRAEEQQRQADNGRDEDLDSAAEEMDSDDEEIVFVGRNGRMRDMQQKRAAAAAAQYRMAHREVSQETVDSGLLFDSFGDDLETAAFKRWLAHAVADYYGLTSRSVTLANAQRVVYVGLKQAPRLQKAVPPLVQLPRPLWEIC